MIEYEGRVFRPPSEAYSLIVQVTIGCSHNKCTFCDMYKEKRFRERKLEEVKADFDEARRMYRRVGRIFLADGDALMCRPEHMAEILRYIKSDNRNQQREKKQSVFFSAPSAVPPDQIKEHGRFLLPAEPSPSESVRKTLPASPRGNSCGVRER